MDYSKFLANKVQEMKPSGIRKFFDMLADMKDVTALTVGQPDFVTPWHIREAAIESIEEGKTYYTANAGMGDLRYEISRYMKRRFDLDYRPEEVFVTVGGSEAIDIAVRSLINPGDEVIIPAPYWLTYPEVVKVCGATPVYLQCKKENKFKFSAEELKAVITPKTKMLIFNSPSNPRVPFTPRQR